MDIEVRPLAERDLDEADRIFRLAFGTLIGLSDPMTFAGDSDLVRPRWRADPTAALGAYRADELVGSNFATRWGSFGFFGPLTVRPDLWNQGVAKALLGPTMGLFERWGVRQRGLYTFPTSERHHALYGKFGFAKQALTPVMSKTVSARASAEDWTTLSALDLDGRSEALADCRTLTDTLMPGLDLREEIVAVATQRLGETVLIWDDATLAAFAVCHMGAGTEAGGGTLYVKFGAARPGPGAEGRFAQLLAACEALAQRNGLQRLSAGTNRARDGACAAMLEAGYEIAMEGVAMQSPDARGFNRADCFVIDDWR